MLGYSHWQGAAVALVARGSQACWGNWRGRLAVPKWNLQAQITDGQEDIQETQEMATSGGPLESGSSAPKGSGRGMSVEDGTGGSRTGQRGLGR